MASTFGAERVRAGALVAALTLIAGCASDTKPAEPSPTDSGSMPDARGADAARVSSDATPPASTGVTAPPDGRPWPTLAEWNLFEDAVAQEPRERVVPYDVIAQLFTDYAFKRRFVYVPEGEHIRYQAAGVWEFPVGTILVKTFSYLTDARDPSLGERLLETRLLVHWADGWTAHTYIWNVEQTEARLERAGDVLQTTFIDPSGEARTNAYVVPNESNCRQCHGKLGETNTLGGKTLQLDRDHDYGSGPVNQIQHLEELGWFEAAPPPAAQRERLVDPFGPAGSVSERARSYMDGNCSHCHRPSDAPGSLSGFWLDYASTAPDQPPLQYGVCKRPASAGHGTCGRPLDVVPGRPEDSILSCRMQSTLSDTAMPPLGRSLIHAEGLALIDEWITSLPGSCPVVGGGDAGPAPGDDAGPGTGGDAGADASSAPDASQGAVDASADAAPSDASAG